MSTIPAATLENILSLAQNASASGGNWVAVYGAIIDGRQNKTEKPRKLLSLGVAPSAPAGEDCNLATMIAACAAVQEDSEPVFRGMDV